MRTEKYKADDLAKLLYERIIATMEELKHALKTDVDLTVLRKLKQLEYITSYSHQGRFYSLLQLAKFDENGLWEAQSARFSKYGTLISTVAILVSTSEAGYYSSELESLLQVGVKETLLRLVQQGRLYREKLSKMYLYCSAEKQERKRQLAMRRALESEPAAGRLPIGEIHDELKAAIVLFFCLLDEQQRRLFAGLESLKWGYGGDRKVSRLLGLDEETVARGRQQLLAQDVEVERARKAGGGRKNVEKKHLRSSRKSKR
jgi:hypothetical protein